MKKYLTLFLLLIAVVLLGAGCELSGDLTKIKDVNLDLDNANNAPAEVKQLEQAEPAGLDDQAKQTDKIFYRSHGKVQGQVKAKFINQETNKPVVGHAIDCVGCVDTYMKKVPNGQPVNIYPESDLNGEVVINVTDDQASIGYARVDWYTYDTVRPLKPGDDVKILLKPQPVKAGQRVLYPKTTYQKNSEGKTQLQVTVADAAGKAVKGYNIYIVGPLYNQARVTPVGSLNTNGRAELPINGAYRLQLLKEGVEAKDFYQFDAPTGYDIKVEITVGQNTQEATENIQKEAVSDFCVKQKNDAESAIGKFGVSSDFKPFFEVWKKAFILANAIDEKYFKEHIFVSGIWQVKEPTNGIIIYSNSLRYYFKLGDVYLATDGDTIRVKEASLENFKNQTAETVLKNPLPANNSGFNEPHPTLGSVPRASVTNYDWGSIVIAKISDLKLISLNCNESVILLKSCQADIKPEMLAYKPRLGRAWLTGSSRNSSNQRSKNKDCAEASVELFGKKLDSCSKGISCSWSIP